MESSSVVVTGAWDTVGEPVARRRSAERALPSDRSDATPARAQRAPISGTQLDDGLWDATQLADHLGVSPRFVRRLVEERRVPFLKIGKFIRFDQREVAAWLRARRVDIAPGR